MEEPPESQNRLDPIKTACLLPGLEQHIHRLTDQNQRIIEKLPKPYLVSSQNLLSPLPLPTELIADSKTCNWNTDYPGISAKVKAKANYSLSMRAGP